MGLQWVAPWLMSMLRLLAGAAVQLHHAQLMQAPLLPGRASALAILQHMQLSVVWCSGDLASLLMSVVHVMTDLAFPRIQSTDAQHVAGLRALL